MTRKLLDQLPLMPGFAVHEHGHELATISAILQGDRQLPKLVAADLTPSGPTRRGQGGRPGLSADQVLRMLILKQLHSLSYEQLAFHLADSVSFQRFCCIGLFDVPPSRSALHANLSRIKAETLQKIHRRIIAFAVRSGVEDGARVRVDCTVTDSNIHHPTDGTLLDDVVRKLTRLMVKASEYTEVPFPDRTKRAKRRSTGIRNAKGFKKMKPLYIDLLKVTREVLECAGRVVDGLARSCPNNRVAARKIGELREQLGHFLELGRRVVDQTDRRVVRGEKVPSLEKVVSIFEEHTDIIRKDHRDTLYGHKLCLSTGASNLVLDCVVLRGNPADSTLAVHMMDRHERLFDQPAKQAAFDGGFASRSNLETIKATGVEDVSFSKGRGLKVNEMVSDQRTYRKLRDFRAGIEGTISFLKRCLGLGRCHWSGWASFESYCWASVISANLLMLARHRVAGSP